MPEEKDYPHVIIPEKTEEPTVTPVGETEQTAEGGPVVYVPEQEMPPANEITLG